MRRSQLFLSRQEQIFETGNQQKAYSLSSWSKDGSSHSEPLKVATSSRKITCLYRCNNCDLPGSIEELRVEISHREKSGGTLHYRNKSETPTLYHEMLLCEFCQVKFRKWQRNGGRGDPSSRCKPVSNNLVASISEWSGAYWKHRFQENGSLPLAGRQVSPGPE